MLQDPYRVGRGESDLQRAVADGYIRSGVWNRPTVLVTTQRLVFVPLLLAFLFTPVAAEADEREDAVAQVEFGIAVARVGLWNEAEYRWKRATEIDPTYAAAWNNLGIAYEQNGRFEEALDAYETALDLEPNNVNIQQNYDLFREIHDRILEADQ